MLHEPSAARHSDQDLLGRTGTTPTGNRKSFRPKQMGRLRQSVLLLQLCDALLSVSILTERSESVDEVSGAEIRPLAWSSASAPVLRPVGGHSS